MGHPSRRNERRGGKSGQAGLEKSTHHWTVSSGILSLLFSVVFLGPEQHLQHVRCSRNYLFNQKMNVSGSFSFPFQAGPFAGRNPLNPRSDSAITQVYLGNLHHLLGAPRRGRARWTSGLFWSLLCMFLIFLHLRQMDTVRLFIAGVF